MGISDVYFDTKPRGIEATCIVVVTGDDLVLVSCPDYFSQISLCTDIAHEKEIAGFPQICPVFTKLNAYKPTPEGM